MSSNKKAREDMERQYGKGCMFKKAHIEEKVEERRTIKTYKKFLKEKKYTGKIISRYEKMMTYHHLQHRAEGGSTNIQNGSIVSEMAHIYLHSLPREQEEIINNELREYKRQLDGCKVTLVDDIPTPYTIKVSEIQLDEKCRLEPYNRAKAKTELQKKAREYIDR